MKKNSIIIAVMVGLIAWLVRLLFGNPVLAEALKKLVSVTWNA